MRKKVGLALGAGSAKGFAHVGVLQELAKAPPELPAVWSTLGDNLRRKERYKEAAAAYDADMAQLHADRGDSYGGGDAAGLDSDAYEKPKFENNVMPGTVKALYLNSEAIRNPEAYIAVADRDDWRFAPLNAPDHDGLAPAWIGLAELDPLVDEGVMYADKLRHAGVAVDLEI